MTGEASVNRLANAKLGTKIYLLVGLLALLAAAIAALGLSAMRTYNRLVADVQQASRRAVIGEQVNAMIFSVVMDSRGVYMARNLAEVQKFGTPLLKTLHEIERLMGAWQALMPEDRKPAMDKALEHVRKFVEYRTELVHIGETEGNPKAREYGDNDANRANRQALNKEIDGLALANNEEIAVLQRAIDDHYHARMLELLGLAGAGIVIAGGLSAIIVVGFIARPVKRLTGVMTELAAGNSEAEVPGTGRGDELGEMSRAVLVFKESMARAAALEAERSAAEEAKAEKRRALDGLVQGFGKDVEAVVRTVAASAGEMKATAQGLKESAERTTERTAGVAASADQTSANVQTVASAAEELHGSIAEIGRQVSHSAEIARNAVAEAGRTDANVTALAEAAQKIGEVIQLIQDIASQTNLLALNATIEAARAGEAGKGFAVVASEVKSLANQTAKATEDIAAQIAAIQGATGTVVGAIRGIGSTITEMSEIATSIASAIEEQGAATREIAGNVQQAAKGTDEVSGNIGAVTQAAAANRESAAALLATASALAEQADTLHGRVEEFVEAVRAA
jgi:methyl-accepting chemotaxis protein